MDKLSDAFASALFFRIVLPGLVFAIGVHPFLRALLYTQSVSSVYPADGTALFIVEVVCFGLIAYAATSSVYYIATGATFPWLTKLSKLTNETRFNGALARYKALYANNQYKDMSEVQKEKVKKLSRYLRDFPILPNKDSIPDHVFQKPTRLGNIIATYEMYSNTRYRISSGDFWYHFLYCMPAEIRKELNSIEATAQGMVLSAAAGWLILVILICAWVGRALYGIQSFVVIGKSPVSDTLLLYLTVYATVVILVFNALARVSHRDYGKNFCAAFDTNSQRFIEWLREHHAPVSSTVAQKGEIINLYLRYLIEGDQNQW